MEQLDTGANLPFTHIYLNSAQRIGGTSHDFTIQLPRLSSWREYNRVAVLSASVPKSWYLLEGDDTFTVDESAIAGGGTRTITIEKGNYSRRSLQNYLTTKLNTGAPAGCVYTIAYGNAADDIISGGPDTGKFYWSITGNASNQPIFSFACLYNLYELLGFVNNTNNAFVADALSSTNILNFQNSETLFLKTDMIQENDAILTEFYYSAQPYLSNILYNNDDIFNTARTLRYGDLLSNNVYRFALYNDNNRPVNLNGVDMLICIIVWHSADYA